MPMALVRQIATVKARDLGTRCAAGSNDTLPSPQAVEAMRDRTHGSVLLRVFLPDLGNKMISATLTTVNVPVLALRTPR